MFQPETSNAVSGRQQGIFGIDLGTTYSVVAYIDETGRPAVTRNSDGDHATASVVYFETGDNVVVGKSAKASAGTDPDNVVSLIKREMPNEYYTRYFWGKEHSPSSISALILAELARNAEETTHRAVRQVVMTVPAYFGLPEKDATRRAGEMAGLEVIGIVPEPVAAALAYGVTGSADGTPFLVYDLGGATFDITLIRMTDSSVEVLAVDGDHNLGGADWDDRLFEHLKQETVTQTGFEDIDEDEGALQEMRRMTEETKQALSKAESKTVTHRLAGKPAKIVVTREQFQVMTADLLEKTVEITRRMLADAEWQFPGIGGQISELLLVGGSSWMPAVAERLSAEFPWVPRVADPDLAVAKGAALYAAGQTVTAVADQTGMETQVLGNISSYVVETAVLSSALVPFIQALATRAAGDVYAMLRRLVSGKRPKVSVPGAGESSAVLIADRYAKVLLRLPPSLDAEMQMSLHRLLGGVTSPGANSGDRWLQISQASGELAGWNAELITEIPEGCVILDGIPALHSRQRRILADPEENRSEKDERISDLEKERKLLRGMVRYLAADIDPGE